MGFPSRLAHEAVSSGWSKREVLDAHRAAGDLAVTHVDPNFAILESRWFLYRGLRCLPDLELALSPRLPLEAFGGLTVAYTDGSSAATGGKKIGYGVALYEPGRPPRYIAEHGGLGTNNQAELLGAWRALKAVPDARRRLTVLSDSQYALGAITERSWALKTNLALVAAIRRDVDLRHALGQELTFDHVAGHAGEEGNELADRLAHAGKTIVERAEPAPL